MSVWVALLALTRAIFDCPHGEWVGFKSELVDFLTSGLETPPASLHARAQNLVQMHAERIRPGPNEYSPPLLMEHILQCNKRQGDACLYGIVNALWVLAFEDSEHIQLALNLLGERTRRNLDFIESSSWPIRSIDLVRARDGYALVPLADLRLAISSRITPRWRVSSGGAIHPQRSSSPHTFVWEVGVHASLSAEVITMIHKNNEGSFNVRLHRRLIQDQYPSWLPNVCAELYAFAGFCDVERDAISQFFQSRIPWSAHLPEPIPEVRKMKQEFEILIRDLALPSLVICTLPVLCYLFSGLPVKLVGYFGHPLLFMVEEGDRSLILEFFRSSQTQFVVSDPFLSMQYAYVLGYEVPFVRTLAYYVKGGGEGRASSKKSTEILVWDRPHEVVHMCSLQLALEEVLPPLRCQPEDFDLLMSVAAAEGIRFVSKSSLADRSYSAFAKFAAILLIPYDMDLVVFYEMVQMGMPILIPDSLDKYMFFQGHLRFDPNQSLLLSPLNESNAQVAFEHLHFADYFHLPSGVTKFSSLQHLVEILLTPNLTRPAFPPEEIDAVSAFWRSL